MAAATTVAPTAPTAPTAPAHSVTTNGEVIAATPPTDAPPTDGPPTDGPPAIASEDQAQQVDDAEISQRFAEAARTIGQNLQSRECTSANFQRTGDARADFLTDHLHFMCELKYSFKLRRIGGAELNLFGLYKAVLERGGLQSVIYNRAFKMVAKTLLLPKTCTSAAFILRSEYEKLLYAYEQKHVWGREPLNLPPLVQVDRRKGLPTRPINLRPRQATPPPAPAAAIHPLQKPSTRPRRHSAGVANPTTNGMSDDPYAHPYFPRRSKLTGLDETSLDTREEQQVEDEVMTEVMPHAPYVPGQPAERDRVVAALQSNLKGDVTWALGTLNALSFDVKNYFLASEFQHVLDGLHGVLHAHLEDVLQKREFGGMGGREEMNERSAQVAELSAMDVRVGNVQELGGVGVTGVTGRDDRRRSSSLQEYKGLFNVADGVAIDRQQCAVVAANVLRNMTFFDRNAIFLANAGGLLNLTALMIENVDVAGNLRDGLMDMWINVSPYLNSSPGCAGQSVLLTVVKLLDPFRQGADMTRFTNCGEVLARLAACPDRNERAIADMFDTVLPRIVDMLGGRHRKYVNAGLAALCNVSAFDWPARDQIARVPRCLDRLVSMLGDAELAPRAAVTLLNLAESPSNRSVLIVYERRLIDFAFLPSPACETVCSILFELDND